jgi:tetratricopeptide (TPR) repeat protein
MKKKIGLLATAFSAAMMVSAAAQMPVPSAEHPVLPGDHNASDFAPRIGAGVGAGSGKPIDRKAPEVIACLDLDHKAAAEARVAGCGKFIDGEKRTGKDVAWAYANRCIAFRALNQTEKALADCDQAIVEDTGNAVARQVRGEIRRSRGNLDGAMTDFDEAIASGEKSAALFSQRGSLAFLKGDNDKALGDFNRVVELAPDNASAYVNRGSVRLMRADFGGAQSDFQHATQLAPKMAAGWMNLGVMEYGGGARPTAANYFRKALAGEPANGYAALWLFIARDGAEDMRDQLKSLATKMPTDFWPAPLLKYYAGAIEAPQVLEAAKTSEQQCEAQFYLGQLRMVKNETDAALPYLRKAVDTCPRDFIEFMAAAGEVKALTPSGQ